MKNKLLIYLLIITVLSQFASAAEVRFYDFWATEGGTTTDYKSWVDEGNPSLQPYVLIANYGSLGPPRVECWDYDGDGTYNVCTSPSATILSECQSNCYLDPPSGRNVEQALGYVCGGMGVSCVACSGIQNDYGYCSPDGSGYTIRDKTFLDWTSTTSVSNPEFRVKYYYNCSPSIGDGTACKQSSYGTGTWTQLAQTIYLGNKKGTDCQSTGSRYFNYKVGYSSSSSTTYGSTGDCYAQPGTQGCDPAKAYWDSGANGVFTSAGAITNPCNGLAGHPCSSSSECISALGLSCIGGFCTTPEVPPSVTPSSPPNGYTYPYNQPQPIYITGSVTTNTYAADTYLDYTINGIQQTKYPTYQPSSTTSSKSYGVGLIPGDSVTWRICADTTPYGGTSLICSSTRSFSIQSSPSYIPPIASLNSPPNGQYYIAGTSTVTFNYSVTAGTYNTQTTLYMDSIVQSGCSGLTIASTSTTYQCTVNVTPGTHTWVVQYLDTSYGGSTNTYTSTRTFTINTSIAPPIITIDQPSEYVINGTGDVSPAVYVETKTENVTLNFWFAAGNTTYNYYSTPQLASTIMTYTPGTFTILCLDYVCSPTQHWVEANSSNATYNVSRPFTIYKNTSVPLIKNQNPDPDEIYPPGTNEINFSAQAIICPTDINECKNAKLYLVLDGILYEVEVVPSTTKAKISYYLKSSIVSGQHTYYWKLDNTLYGGTTNTDSTPTNFTIQFYEPGYEPPTVVNTAPTTGVVYPFGTTVYIQGNVTLGTFAADTYYLLDGIHYAIENGLNLTPNTTKPYNIPLSGLSPGQHNWTFGITDYRFTNGTATNVTDTMRNFNISVVLTNTSITLLTPPNGTTGAGISQVVTASVTTTNAPAEIILKYKIGSNPYQMVGLGTQPVNTTTSYHQSIVASQSVNVSWTYCADSISNCADEWIYTTTTCLPNKQACSANADCCSNYCSRGYCAYDTGFYEIDIPVDGNGNPMLVNVNNPTCDDSTGESCGLIPEIYRGAFIIFSKIGHPLIILMSVVILCLFVLAMGAFVIRIARGP